jgi:menaquinone-9 beta-reductase
VSEPRNVVVVGGGPAGSATALLLARAGVEVRIVERARFPRRKVCGEYLNAGAVEALDRLGLLDAVKAAAAPLHGVRLVAAGAPPVVLPFRRPALACARDVLDAIVLDAARAAGAVVEHARAEDVIVDEGWVAGVMVRTESGELEERRAAYTVGADGSGSFVARCCALVKRPPRTARYAVGGHYEGFAGLDGHVEMYVGGGAYFALNPLSEVCANVMVVVPKERLSEWSRDVDAGVGGAAAALGRGVRSFENVTRIGARMAMGPLANGRRVAYQADAVLVGDAAGFLDPFTGQGVYLALAGAERAADAILGALRTGGSRFETLERYARWRARDVAWRARLSKAVALLVDVPVLARRAAARIERFPAAGAALIDALSGVVPPQRAFRPAVLGRLLA